MVRLAHFSDIHVTAQPLGFRPRDLLHKRVPGWLNLRFLRRGRSFRHADAATAALALELRETQPDHIVFSGDATALGFESELKQAVRLLGLTECDPLPGIAVPGNHDYYTREVAASGDFERYFAAWQTGLRVENAVYPFARRVGSIWLIGVNSCTGNRWFWDAAGSVGAEQLCRLKILLGRLDEGLRVLVTHYPVCLESGRPENKHHHLRDLDALLDVAVRGGVKLWLHGHRHNPYVVLAKDNAPFPVICTGSATQSKLWSYGQYEFQASTLHIQRRVFSPESGQFRDGEQCTLQLH